jgi:hypothetical protein
MELNEVLTPLVGFPAGWLESSLDVEVELHELEVELELHNTSLSRREAGLLPVLLLESQLSSSRQGDVQALLLLLLLLLLDTLPLELELTALCCRGH